MRKRSLWLMCVFVLLCSCVALLYAGTLFTAKRVTAVLSVTTLQTAPQTLSAGKSAPAETTQFPALVEGTTLMAESLAMYEGDMLENDSDTFLVDAAALELRNFGSREVELAEVTLEFDHNQMVFFGTNIPAGGTVLIIEQDGKPWTRNTCTSCYGWAQYNENTTLTDSDIRIEDVDMGTVSVTNRTDKVLKDVWLFYKNYLYDAQIYLGGITYVEVIPELSPGETILITPERYASGYSKFIKAELVN